MIDSYFRNDRCCDFGQIVAAFTLGIIFSPWSWGLLYFLLFIIGYELVAIYMTAAEEPYWRFETRIGVIAASILGFVIGRIIDGFPDPLQNMPKKKLPKKNDSLSNLSMVR